MQLDLSREDVDLILLALGEHELRRNTKGLNTSHVVALTNKIEGQVAKPDGLSQTATVKNPPVKKTRLFQQKRKKE